MFALNDNYEKGNLVLLFIPKDASAADLSSVEMIFNQQTRIKRESARLLALYPAPFDSLLNYQDPAIPVLVDAGSNTRESFADLIAPDLTSERDIMIFILDTYGAPWVCLVGQKPGESFTEEIMSWLLYISIQCPE